MSLHDYECPRIDDAAGYVLRAIPDGERDDYQEHLATCPDCAQKAADLGFVGDALLNAVPQVSAPPEIRNRVMAVVRAESELLRAAGPAADRPAPAPQPEPSRRRRWMLSLRATQVAALASVALVVGVGGGALLTGGGAERTVAARVDAAGAKARLRLSADGAKLVVAGMPSPPEGRVYQVWLDRGRAGRPPEPTDALFSVNRDGHASVDVPGDLDGVRAVLVTDEPLGGSRLPTRAPVIAARLA